MHRKHMISTKHEGMSYNKSPYRVKAPQSNLTLPYQLWKLQNPSDEEGELLKRAKESPTMRFLKVLKQCERRNVNQIGLVYPVILPNMFPSRHLKNNEPYVERMEVH